MGGFRVPAPLLHHILAIATDAAPLLNEEVKPLGSSLPAIANHIGLPNLGFSGVGSALHHILAIATDEAPLLNEEVKPLGSSLHAIANQIGLPNLGFSGAGVRSLLS